jgi:hypothetical protein
MIRPLRFLPPYLIIFLFVIAPCIARAEADTASVAKILAGDERFGTAHMDDQEIEKLLDTVAGSETKRLDQNNSDWNASSPEWKPVYDRIRADLESEKPSIIAAMNNELQAQEADIASQLSQSDVDAILAYYRTPEGQRYQEFMRRVDKILVAGELAFVKRDLQRTAARPSPDQMKRYFRMLQLSRMVQPIIVSSQMAEANHQGAEWYGSGDMIAFMGAAAINKSPQELDTLDKAYAGDLAGFEAFTKSPPAQHLFAAMGQSMVNFAKTGQPADPIRTVVQKHESEWMALYRAQAKP